MNPLPEIIPAQAHDTDVLSSLIATAFHHLAPSAWLIPDTHERHLRMPDYFRIFVADAIARGHVYTTPQADGVALWIPVTETGDTGPDGYDQALAAATRTWLHRFKTFDEQLAAHHPTGLRHDHLAILAVHPTSQRRGIGTALLAAHHERLDRAEPPVAAYLEASDAQTRRIYLARGYADHGDPIQLPGGPEMFPMIRPARSATASPPLATATAAAR